MTDGRSPDVSRAGGNESSFSRPPTPLSDFLPRRDPLQPPSEKILHFFRTLPEYYPNGLGIHATSGKNFESILAKGLFTGTDGLLWTKIIDPSRDPRAELRECIAQGNADEAYDRLRLGIKLILGYGQQSPTDRLSIVEFSYPDANIRPNNHRPSEFPSVALKLQLDPAHIRTIFVTQEVEDAGGKRLETSEEMANRIARTLVQSAK